MGKRKIASKTARIIQSQSEKSGKNQDFWQELNVLRLEMKTKNEKGKLQFQKKFGKK